MANVHVTEHRNVAIAQDVALSIALLFNAVPRLRSRETVDTGTALGAGSTAG